MASRALAAYERAGGNRLIYVGETAGGQRGDDQFFESLATRWQLVAQDPNHVSWWNLHDVAQCWVRMT